MSDTYLYADKNPEQPGALSEQAEEISRADDAGVATASDAADEPAVASDTDVVAEAPAAPASLAAPVAEPAAEREAGEEDSDPVEEFRQALRTAPGEWYVVHSYAGYENRVKANLENRIASLNMEDYIFQVEVP